MLGTALSQDVLRGLLPPAPARSLDTGADGGAHAEWLAADGHDVELLDPVPPHGDRAAWLPGVRARHGDTRALEAPDTSVDVVPPPPGPRDVLCLRSRHVGATRAGCSRPLSHRDAPLTPTGRLRPARCGVELPPAPAGGRRDFGDRP
ncbi:hypothetical protein AB0L59_15890 [Streptomyces sp. NPDC052109]|uniref:hypothetical protein n=1 Tax=Streptomyces sp. NPDC052109 TaxID=3155527 RepID=UPI0034464693